MRIISMTKSAVIVLLFLQFLFSQPADIKFEQLSVEHGLSQSRVFSILQDHQGFMWFGTRNGLNKYDGYKFAIYKNDPNDSLSLSHNGISALYENHSGELWIGTDRGLWSPIPFYFDNHRSYKNRCLLPYFPPVRPFTIRPGPITVMFCTMAETVNPF